MPKPNSYIPICLITKKPVEEASPSDRYCPCDVCQAYLAGILAAFSVYDEERGGSGKV